LVLNEINTLPGFTSISMYPKLWEASGISYSDLLDHLINLGIQRHKKVSKLKQV
jgi:D-alanine-D-alanine ligase